MELAQLKEKARWIWRETVRVHGLAPETRVASSLSDVEIFTTLYYGGILRHKHGDPDWVERDRMIVSKGHGGISLYPILADIGYFPLAELDRICTESSFLGSIPDHIPGFETINGSLGHGPGVGCGLAVALRAKKSDSRVYVLCGDGEMNSGAVWEAIMFAAFHKLGNMTLIVDDNEISMLGFQKDILGLSPLAEKLKAFHWEVQEVDGHDIPALLDVLRPLARRQDGPPQAIVARTIKGRGAPQLENKPLCHVMNLSKEDIRSLLGEEK
ncbi:MAG: transketolase [Planctomycetes bacterium]|nr:transketolase [Planctomycetota bacterium]